MGRPPFLIAVTCFYSRGAHSIIASGLFRFVIILGQRNSGRNWALVGPNFVVLAIGPFPLIVFVAKLE